MERRYLFKVLEQISKVMTPIRTNNLYISSQLHRWLKWLSAMDEISGTASNPDAVAETLLRSLILKAHPGIEQLEHDYWTARKKLDSETVTKLKEQTNAKPTTA